LLLVLDGNSILNRAFYGIKLLTNKQGMPTNAVFGFLQILHSLQDQIKPDGIAVAFDLPDKTFRHHMFENYKAGRKGMPDELAVQLPAIKEVLAAIGCTLLMTPGYEADDILGTFAKKALEAGEAHIEEYQ
jgi:DNA polymerase-1